MAATGTARRSYGRFATRVGGVETTRDEDLGRSMPATIGPRPTHRFTDALLTVLALVVIAAVSWLLWCFGFSGGGA